MDLNDLLVQIDARKADIASLPPLPSEVEQRLRQKFRLDWNYQANAIEGNSLTFEEVKTLLLEGKTPRGAKPIRHVDDIRGHDRALRFLEEFVATKAPLTIGVLGQMHSLLLPEEYDLEALMQDGKSVTRQVGPGRLRTWPAFARTLGGELFQFTPPSEIERQLSDLLRGPAERRPAEHPVVQAARWHHKFLAIHPFADGNGRLGRLLMNGLLLGQGYAPVLFQKEDRRAYLGALQSADAGDEAEWQSFIAQHLLEAATLYLRGARGESMEEADDVDKALLRLKRELAGIEEPQELSQERFRRVLTGSIGPLVIRLVEKLRQFDELYSAERLSISCQVYSDAALQASAPGPALSGRKNHVKKWLADFPATMVMSEMAVTFSWDGFRKGGLNDFGTSLTVRFVFEKRKYHLHCEPLSLARHFMYQQRLPEEESRQILNQVARHLLGQIRQELERQKQ